MGYPQKSILTLLAVGTLAGLFGTWCMDQAGTRLRRRGIIAGPPAQQVAKWFAYLRRGRMRHADIAASPEIPISYSRLWVLHYGIGAVLGIGYPALHLLSSHETSAERMLSSVVELDATALSRSLEAQLSYSLPTELLLALAFGVGTSLFAWFILFPGMGYGVFGRCAPASLKLLRSSLINHAVYGLGVGVFWISARLLGFG